MWGNKYVLFLLCLKLKQTNACLFHQFGGCGKEVACQPVQGDCVQLLPCGIISRRNLSKRYDNPPPTPSCCFFFSLLSKNNICLHEGILFLTDVRWPSSNLVVLNTASRWTESVRDANTVARDLLSRMVKLLKGILYLIGQEKEWVPFTPVMTIRLNARVAKPVTGKNVYAKGFKLLNRFSTFSSSQRFL